MKTSLKILAAAGLALATLSGTAMARDNVSFGLSIGAPAPVYVAPAPTYVEPAYVAPAPGYYTEPAYVAPPVVAFNGYVGPRFYDHRRFEHREWREHHDHDRH